jgi:hypothetical protein
MLTVNLQGGLGNQLFQLAAGEYIATQTGRRFYLDVSTTPVTHHSSQNYLTSVFRKWNSFQSCTHPTSFVQEPSYALQDWRSRLGDMPHVRLNGYFQNYQYVQSSFLERLELPSQSFDRNGVFLHIRGGDYKNHSLHDVGLSDTYYPWAIQQFPEDTHFYVFTNDIPYAKSMPFLKGIHWSIVETDELQALNCMRQCSGGICANSTFSWWGAYLKPNRKLILPDTWFHDSSIHIDGYFFPGCIKGPVKAAPLSE